MSKPEFSLKELLQLNESLLTNQNEAGETLHLIGLVQEMDKAFFGYTLGRSDIPRGGSFAFNIAKDSCNNIALGEKANIYQMLLHALSFYPFTHISNISPDLSYTAPKQVNDRLNGLKKYDLVREFCSPSLRQKLKEELSLHLLLSTEKDKFEDYLFSLQTIRQRYKSVLNFQLSGAINMFQFIFVPYLIKRWEHEESSCSLNEFKTLLMGLVKMNMKFLLNESLMAKVEDMEPFKKLCRDSNDDTIEKRFFVTFFDLHFKDMKKYLNDRDRKAQHFNNNGLLGTCAQGDLFRVFKRINTLLETYSLDEVLELFEGSLIKYRAIAGNEPTDETTLLATYSFLGNLFYSKFQIQKMINKSLKEKKGIHAIKDIVTSSHRYLYYALNRNSSFSAAFSKILKDNYEELKKRLGK